MFGNKGQGAMEYLMTYGWAILVVMIVGIVMWQLGIFNMGSAVPTASGFNKIKPQLASVVYDEADNFQVMFTNGAGATINFDAATNTIVVTADGTVTGCNEGNLVNVGALSIDAATYDGASVPVGDNFIFAWNQAAGVPDADAGDIFNIELEFDYQVRVGGAQVTHTERGVLRGPVTP